MSQSTNSTTGVDRSSGEFRIRRMRPEDIPSFIELGLPTCAFMHGRPDLSDQKMRQNFSSFVREHAFAEESEIYIATDPSGSHAGQLWLHTTRNRFNGKRELWIWDVTVHPDFRRKGLGHQLLDFAKRQAEMRRADELWLLVSSVNYHAIRLYRTSGLRGLGQLMCVPLSGSLRTERTISFGATMLRPLASNDAEGLHELWTAAGLPYRPQGRDTVTRLRAFLNSSDAPGWCACSDDALIGAALITNDSRKGWIERLAVHPEHRRAGLAKALISACVNSLRQRDILVIGALIDVENEPSRSLFECCGFVHHPGICYYSFRENKDS